jgi:nitrogen-specific signal transduction histidine kinase
MKEVDKKRVQDLLQRLERLETQRPTPEKSAIHAVAQQAIVEEISKLVRQDWLAVYRSGGTLDAVSFA